MPDDRPAPYDWSLEPFEDALVAAFPLPDRECPVCKGTGLIHILREVGDYTSPSTAPCADCAPLRGDQ